MSFGATKGSHPVVERIIQVVNQSRWPNAHRSAERNRRIYEYGLDQVNSYYGDPAIYFQALETFADTRSCGYAYAGIAFVLVMASSITREEVDEAGFEEAMRWLEKGQEWEPNMVEINFIEAVLYINSGQMENGRLVLDHLAREAPDNYYLCLTEMNYWSRQKNFDKYVSWLKKANKLADTKLRQARTLSALANLYFDQGQLDHSIKTYRDVVKLTPGDAWAWNNMSYIFLKMNKLKEAEMCNQRALEILDFGAARNIQEQIRQNKGGLSRLFRK